jgi:hypothetical protein
MEQKIKAIHTYKTMIFVKKMVKTMMKMKIDEMIADNKKLLMIAITTTTTTSTTTTTKTKKSKQSRSTK